MGDARRRLVPVGGRRRAVIAATLVASVLLVASVAVAEPGGGSGYAGSSGDPRVEGRSEVVAQPAGAVPGIDRFVVLG
jgi:hypothetical protein